MLTHYVTTFRGLRQRGALRIAASHSSSCLGPGPAATADVSRGIGRHAATKAAAAANEPQQLFQSTAAAAAAAAAAAPGRHYLPAATTAVLLPPTAQLTLHISSSQLGEGATQVLVINATQAADQRFMLLPAPHTAAAAAGSGGKSPHVALHSSACAPPAVAAAAAAAAGRRPMLPSWLFGFACGSAAATAAAAVGYLNPPNSFTGQQQQQRGLHSAADMSRAAPITGQHAWQQSISKTRETQHYGSSSSSSSSSSVDAELRAALEEVLTSLQPGTTGGSNGAISSSMGTVTSSSSSSKGMSAACSGVIGSVLGFLSGLLPFGTAQAATPSADAPGSVLPTPWETDSSTSSPDAATAAFSSSSSSSSSSGTVMSRSSIAEAAAAAAPAVVHLVATAAPAAGATSGGSTPGSSAWDGSRPQGSGFIYDSQGYILTNAHVVMGTTAPPGDSAAADGQTNSSSGGSSSKKSGWPFRQQQVSSSSSSSSRLPRQHSNSSSSSSGSVLVYLSDGRVYEGRVVACDAASDLAVVKVDAEGPLPTAQLGASSRLRVGEWVVALGSPFLLKQSVTAGIISCVERKGSELGLSSPGTDFIQTDAAINAGNSGGPLVDLDGCVVAMNTMKAAPAAGVSFAIPIDNIKQLVSELSRHGRILRPYAGIKMTEVSPARMAQLRTACPDFPAAVSSGIVVTRVTPGSPAAEAGLMEDDVIVGIGSCSSSSSSTRDDGAVITPPLLVDEYVQQQQQQGLGLSVADLADALKAGIGGSLELVVVREIDRSAGSSSSGGSTQSKAANGRDAVADAAASAPNSNFAGNSNGSGRYQFVRVMLHPEEAS